MEILLDHKLIAEGMKARVLPGTLISRCEARGRALPIHLRIIVGITFHVYFTEFWIAHTVATCLDVSRDAIPEARVRVDTTCFKVR